MNVDIVGIVRKRSTKHRSDKGQPSMTMNTEYGGSVQTATARDSGAECRCSLCKTHPLRFRLLGLLAGGMPPHGIEQESRRLGIPIKRETVKKHVDTCKDCSPTVEPVSAGIDLSSTINPRSSINITKLIDASDTLPEVVVKSVRERIVKGEIRPSVRDGISAQALIDRKKEVTKHQAFLLNLARLLSGAGQNVPVHVIEGEYREVEDPKLLMDGASDEETS